MNTSVLSCDIVWWWVRRKQKVEQFFLLSRECPPSAFCNENVLFIAHVHLLHPLVHPCVVNHKSERRRKILLLRHERDVIESYRELTYENIIVSRICRSGDGEEVLKKRRIREKICEKFRRLGCIVNFQRGDRFRVRILLIVIEKRRGEGKKSCANVFTIIMITIRV